MWAATWPRQRIALDRSPGRSPWHRPGAARPVAAEGEREAPRFDDAAEGGIPAEEAEPPVECVAVEVAAVEVVESRTETTNHDWW